MASQDTQNVTLRAAFSREEHAGLCFAFRLRLATLALIAAWLVYSVNEFRVIYYLGLVVLFIGLGGLPLLLRRYDLWSTGAMIGVALLEAALVTFALLAPNPLSDGSWPLQMTLRFHSFLYFFVFLAAAALSYSPVQVLCNGMAAAAMWSFGVYLIWSRSDTITAADGEITNPDGFLSPYFVNVIRWQNEVVLMLIVAGLLAAAVWRARRLVVRQIITEQARSNLARYFSPNLVDQLASTNHPFDTPREQNVAVMFVDIVDFMSMAETMEPERAFEMLRSFHQRMCSVVFAHQGTIDKYIGDAVLATFGTPKTGYRDATNALECAHAMLQEIDRWNLDRSPGGASIIKVGIGVHYGPVVAGNIGDARRLEFTVIGDVVNVASRLERLTRSYDSPLIVSRDLIDAVRREDGPSQDFFIGFTKGHYAKVRGRQQPISIWIFDN